ncbi:transmembrane protein, putative (macronuclear) [Tetrahymena thermophila SB210]|uniref:Transmembrane protein, putative n=1 Tax=Tetrahymena thermophila (strain SB210) TaxID=312017 RepID=W7XCG2_TETTS|nr:transmembrane protein, putative [Tetrahymena thermophila SB210]EWS74248.1 transmembrane protein, putative [Tetrahymena thermophila SB210]|eukprot:XP_012653221.1 transmembrane protein, putative [Tetrahymena thermophila SB210]
MLFLLNIILKYKYNFQQIKYALITILVLKFRLLLIGLGALYQQRNFNKFYQKINIQILLKYFLKCVNLALQCYMFGGEKLGIAQMRLFDLCKLYIQITCTSSKNQSDQRIIRDNIKILLITILKQKNLQNKNYLYKIQEQQLLEFFQHMTNYSSLFPTIF